MYCRCHYISTCTIHTTYIYLRYLKIEYTILTLRVYKSKYIVLKFECFYSYYAELSDDDDKRSSSSSSSSSSCSLFHRRKQTLKAFFSSLCDETRSRLRMILFPTGLIRFSLGWFLPISVSRLLVFVWQISNYA